MPATLITIPLFPLGSMLFPQGVIHLNIFELRYITMIRECHKNGTEFGLVGIEEGSEVSKPGMQTLNFFEIGTLARIVDFVEIEPSLFQIRCEGGSRFKIHSSALQKNGLWVGEIETLAGDSHIEVPDELDESVNILGKLIKHFQKSGVPPEQFPFSQPYRLNDCGWVANRWAELLPINNLQKKLLLEQTNPRIRLDLAFELLQQKQIQFDDE
jgi:Lon protease-like protein